MKRPTRISTLSFIFRVVLSPVLFSVSNISLRSHCVLPPSSCAFVVPVCQQHTSQVRGRAPLSYCASPPSSCTFVMPVFGWAVRCILTQVRGVPVIRVWQEPCPRWGVSSILTQVRGAGTLHTMGCRQHMQSRGSAARSPVKIFIQDDHISAVRLHVSSEALLTVLRP
ncbi:hypothetical protein PLICRDRAFT_350455 [Plicaturopsis crispa FD-325 SS-3]|uniref:Secreted protein n=1 Tax=Plicaturopsis crispa FD-325 SS-3 TaxID=944288 RepID=A0A0C9SYD7_PLICR|nr:hypothetical protein PLICRDRAFT_350455 [Plicaturopsis crispa FD-325 SS-3]